jgi:hypothetical protein
MLSAAGLFSATSRTPMFASSFQEPMRISSRAEKRPYSCEIANGFLKHGFRAENPNVLSALFSIGRRQRKWLETRHIKATFSETADCRASLQDIHQGLSRL